MLMCLTKVWDRSYTVQAVVDIDADIEVIIKMKQPKQKKLRKIWTDWLDLQDGIKDCYAAKT